MNKACLFFLFSCCMAACSIDAYDKGEGEYSLLTAEMADVVVDSRKQVTTAMTDQGEQLTLSKPVTMKWMEKGDTTYRALFYYKVQTDGKVEAVSMNRVGVLIPQTLVANNSSQQADTMKTDPLYVESIWMGKNKKYVNMRLRVLTGATDDEKAVQTIGIMRDSVTSTSGHEQLVLYHNQGGRPEYYSTTAYVSIPLDIVKADTLTVTVNTYNGLFTRTFFKTTD